MTVILVSAVFLAALVGTVYYRRFAIARGIVAVQNSRTLHDKIVPRGGGIAFAIVFSAGVILAWMGGELPRWAMFGMGIGGAAAAAVGFVDDVHDVRPLHKLLLQVILSAGLFSVFYSQYYAELFETAGLAMGTAITLFVLFIPMWMINLYNFIDGIDGMAAAGGLFICGAALIALTLGGGDRVLIFLFALLAAAILGFLYLNLPPASIFMGDAGSIFLGFSFSALMFASVGSGQLSLWTWLAIMGYYIADTTTTTVCRMFMVKRWYGEHRSHAYQNLARILKSHARVTYGVALYNVVWALPLVVWSVVSPSWAPIAAALSLAPAVVWTLRFGPPLSSS